VPAHHWIATDLKQQWSWFPAACGPQDSNPGVWTIPRFLHLHESYGSHKANSSVFSGNSVRLLCSAELQAAVSGFLPLKGDFLE